jgi:beta-glucanase (GH16 family)
LKKKLTPSTKNKKTDKKINTRFFIAAVVILLVAAVGYNLLLASHAESPYASTYASGGTLSGTATLVSTTSSDSGKVVEFAAPTTTTGSQAGCTNDGVVAPCIGTASGTGASGWGTPSFDDEFSSDTSLNLNKWQPNWLAGNNTENTSPDNSSEDNCESPNNVSVSGGYLNLALTDQSCVAANNGETYTYTGSLVNTHSSFSIEYGFVETRMYLTPGTGNCDNWPAFWLDGPNWPTDGEIDVMECLTGYPNYHFHYESSGAPGGSGQYLSNNSGWHTFAVDIAHGSTSCSGSQPDSVDTTYYYDGTDVGSITECIDDVGLYIILNNDTSTGSIQAAPSTVKFQYMRAWE